MEFTQKDIDRFWSKVDKTTTPDGCWNYICGIGNHGYGVFWHNKKQTTAPRFSYESTYGQIPEGKSRYDNVVMHICDNRRCCRPDHLVLGTQKDNMDDMKNKGRKAKVYGEKQGNHKLTEAQVLEIRSIQNMLHREIAAIYGVNRQTIGFVLSRKTWPHI